MSSSSRFALSLLLLCVFVNSASAFGAGSLPDDSEFKEFVWRHGDITEVLRFLPSSFITGVVFTQLQRRQIYFGNWLRDFSQVMDTACLEKMPEPILRAVVCVMAMMEFGFSTDEFDVTRERLGCYTHVEHIDNPRGYPDNAKDVDERLRGPVDPKELEFDPESGMKNYIANSGKGWDTAADYIRNQLQECIDLGRQGRDGDEAATKESFIRLGAALHTLEDFAAHSNFIELCLYEMGEKSVFLFVGDGCRVALPSHAGPGRKVAPLVTGTFGMLDIFHSLLGEADDKAILQSKGSLDQIDASEGYGPAAFDQLLKAIKGAMSVLPDMSSSDDDDDLKKGSEDSNSSDKGNSTKDKKDNKDGDKDGNKSNKASSKQDKKGNNNESGDQGGIMEELEAVNKIFQDWKPASGTSSKDASDDEGDAEQDTSGSVDSTVLWKALEPVLAFHDKMKKSVQDPSEGPESQSSGQSSSKAGELVDNFVFQVVGTVIKSSVKELRDTLRTAKSKVDEEAASADSAAVFEDGSSASDPSHSDLSKDHFSNLLNPPAGLLATVTSNWATQKIVKCWDDANLSADDTISEILTILHHPAFPKEKSEIQSFMYTVVETWWGKLPKNEKSLMREKLTKDNVKEREHEDHRLEVKPNGRKGPGEFPGSRVEVIVPRRKKALLLEWMKNTVVTFARGASQKVLGLLLLPFRIVSKAMHKVKVTVIGPADSTGEAVGGSRQRRQPA